HCSPLLFSHTTSPPVLSPLSLHDALPIFFDCCDQKPNSNEPGGDCCYDAWMGDLVQVTSDWKAANAYASNKELEYNLSIEERDRLKAWFADWEATDENADALCRQLELFILLLQKVCIV